MILSDGSASSMTGPLDLIPSQLNATDRAGARFHVSGNAIVTGGAGILGLAASRALLEHGLSKLMIFDANISQTKPEIDRLREDFPTATILATVVDVSDDVEVNKAVEATLQTFGSVTILLCFAGVVGCVDAIEATPKQWRRVLDINTSGSFWCAQAVAKQMVKQQSGGSIVFISSISAHRVNFPQPQAAYNVSKAALITLKNCLAAEWARYGIRTNTISPGYMDTVLNEGAGIAEARRIWAERNPSGRMGVPSELTGAVVLLASASGTYINGVDIVVDGGGIVF